jgi:hypothetical protein
MKIKCESCHNEFHSFLKACPKCRAENPAPDKLSVAYKIGAYLMLGIATALLLGMLGLTFWGMFLAQEYVVSWYKNLGAENEHPAAQEYEACKRNLSCWAQKNVSSADSYCGTEIEKLASISFRWDGGGAIMKTYKWLDSPSGYVTYTGDNIEIKDKHGVYNNFIFSCDFDPTDNRVMNVRVLPGRL